MGWRSTSAALVEIKWIPASDDHAHGPARGAYPLSDRNMCSERQAGSAIMIDCCRTPSGQPS